MRYSQQLPNISPPTPPTAAPPPRGRFSFWFDLTAPPRPLERAATALQREELRKGELTSVFLLLFVVVGILSIPAVFIYAPSNILLEAVLGYLGFFVLVSVIAWFNRREAIRTAATLLVAAVMIAIALRTIFASDYSHAAFLLPDYDSFTFGILLSTLILPRRFILPFALLALGYVIFDFMAISHGPGGDVDALRRNTSDSSGKHAQLLHTRPCLTCAG